MKFYTAGVLILTSTASFAACGVTGDKFARAHCEFGWGIAHVTAPISLIDYGASKASTNERLIPSDKQAEFIVGPPLAFAAFNYLFRDEFEPSILSGRGIHIAPYVAASTAVGVSFYTQF